MKNLLNYSVLVGGAACMLAFQSYIGEPTKSYSFNSPFELSLDDKVYLPKAKKELSISLLSITDNRCPENVQCITAGSAVAEVRLVSKDGTEATGKLILGKSGNEIKASDTLVVTLDDDKYTVVLTEVSRLFANRAKLIVKKTAI